ncbi:MAG TPA: helix-turn-helix transcriptional regulator, partial [Kofleriaceae bacterium]|nr:helix-turn-helix transcriptional regulator [Kofleriaceae bacterium]
LEWLRDQRGVTERQLEVAELALRGTTQPLIARELGISRETVKRHIRSLLGRAGVRNVRELGALAQMMHVH